MTQMMSENRKQKQNAVLSQKLKFLQAIAFLPVAIAQCYESAAAYRLRKMTSESSLESDIEKQLNAVIDLPLIMKQIQIDFQVLRRDRCECQSRVYIGRIVLQRRTAGTFVLLLREEIKIPVNLHDNFKFSHLFYRVLVAVQRRFREAFSSLSLFPSSRLRFLLPPSFYSRCPLLSSWLLMFAAAAQTTKLTTIWAIRKQLLRYLRTVLHLHDLHD